MASAAHCPLMTQPQRDPDSLASVLVQVVVVVGGACERGRGVAGGGRADAGRGGGDHAPVAGLRALRQRHDGTVAGWVGWALWSVVESCGL
jgi:hypothetical protein